MYPATIAKLDTHNKLVYNAYCPTHRKVSKLIRGKQANLLGEVVAWVFKCGPDRGPGHLFLTEPCTIDPQTAEEYALEVQKLMTEKALAIANKGQKVSRSLT